MKISFHGATGDVTGSAYHVITKDASVLVDCGFFQGPKQERARSRAALEGDRIDSVILTHADLNHVSRLPLLTRNGYKGPIYATEATIELASMMLRDSIDLQRADQARENRKRARSGLAPLELPYLEDDVTQLQRLGKAIAYGELIEVAPGIEVRLADAGHVIGSASIEMTVQEDGHKKVVVFSGDLGPRGSPLLNNLVSFGRADAVIMESTYGDRDHRSLQETAIEVHQIAAKAVEDRAKILVPLPAVGRNQLLLSLLSAAFSNNTLPPFPIYLDSPLAMEATRIYENNTELFDIEALEMVKSGELGRDLGFVHPCPSPQDSRVLNDVQGPCLIMAGNGMCTGGRIIHHLRHNLHLAKTAVLIVGFQSPGTLGRHLVDGKKSVSILGERITVRASIHTLGALSAHAGQGDLLNWIAAMAPSRPRVIITHGEDRARRVLSNIITARHALIPECPRLSDVIEI